MTHASRLTFIDDSGHLVVVALEHDGHGGHVDPLAHVGDVAVGQVAPADLHHERVEVRLAVGRYQVD